MISLALKQNEETQLLHPTTWTPCKLAYSDHGGGCNRGEVALPEDTIGGRDQKRHASSEFHFEPDGGKVGTKTHTVWG